MGHCGSKLKASKHIPIYKTILARIFSISREGSKLRKKHAEKHVNKYTDTSSGEPIDVAKLEAHVASHMKGLVDYLESNHNKLVDVGNSVSKTVTKSSNPETHILGLIVLRNLLKEIQRFSHDSELICKLIGGPGLDRGVSTIQEKKIANKNTVRGSDINIETDPDMVGYNSDIMGNLKQFEGSVLEVLWFIFEKKRNSLYPATYKYALEVLSCYSKNHVGWMPTERIEYLMTEALETISLYNHLDNKENLDLHCGLLEVMINISKISNVVFSFKFKFTQYSCQLLRDIYHTYGNKDNNLLDNNTEVSEAREYTKRKAFELLGVIVRSLSDLSEFDVLVVPILSFFDKTQWSDEELQKDIFTSFINSTKDNSTFDQIEIFLIEKIVEYIDYRYAPNPVNQNPLFQNNNDCAVKMRAFALLEDILTEVRKTFLSFLIVDKLVRCFINNLESKEVVTCRDLGLKDSIYSCQKIFLTKINNSSRTLAQLVNSIVTQIYQKYQENISNESQVVELLKFLEFSIDYVNCFPSQIYLPRNSLLVLLKLREMTNVTLQAFPVIEKLLNLTYDSEASPNDRRHQKGNILLPCEGDVVYVMLASNLEMLKNLVENRRTVTTETQALKDLRLLAFLLHCTRINDNLLIRKDSALLPFQFAFIKKIMELSQSELKNYESKQNSICKENSGILLYSVFHFVRNFAGKWEMGGMRPYVEGLAVRVPFAVVNTIEAHKEILTKEEVIRIYNSFDSFDFPDPNWYDEEYSVFLDLVTSELQNRSFSAPLDNLRKEFEELDPYSAVGTLLAFGDETTQGHSAFEKKTSINLGQPTEDIKTKLKRKESLTLFDRVNVNPNILKQPSGISQKTTQGTQGYLDGESMDSDLMDNSFKKALKDAKIQKESLTEGNLMRILEEETY